MLRNKISYGLGFCFFLLTICNSRYAICLYAQEQFTYDAKAKRDPFIPLVTADGRLLKLKSSDTVALSLEGIIYDKYGLSYAMVNGNAVKIGDKVGEYQVLKIEENRVLFIKDGEISEIKLKKEEP